MACNSDGALPPSANGGAGVASGGRLAGSGGSDDGNQTGGSSGARSDGGSGAGSSGGASGGASLGGAAGEPSVGSGGAGGSSGGADSETAGAGGEAGAPEPAVNGCTSFVDRTGASAARSLIWDESLLSSGIRCLMIRVGQSVSFVGDFEQHPLLPLGGDEPNPVADNAVYEVPGTYGYYCPAHPSDMNGAIRVVP